MESMDERAEDEIASLQAILLGPSARRLDALQARLEDRAARAEDVGEVLPQVLIRHADNPALARALTPPIERAITSSVKRNPKPLADALFPVMGPAIRKAVAASLAAMMESLNRTLEHAVSWRSIRWRLEALRTHRSFTEIVLLHTLLYRVEQVFLIDRRSGILLQHVQAGSAALQDADMVSGMLTAIRDFVQDSFRVDDSESLEALKVGELSVWIEAGPYAIIAAVIRGSAPRELRPMLQEALEGIHLQFGSALERFEGDTSELDGARPILEACLASEYRADAQPRQSRRAWILFGVIVAAAAIWMGLSYRAQTRFTRYLDALRAEPGLTVISSGRRGGRFVVHGLRDPLAPDPRSFLAAAGLAPDDVEGHWTAYHALDPPLVLARARHVLRPPPGITLSLADGVIAASGTAPVEWIQDARRLGPLIGGVTAFDARGAIDAVRRAATTTVEGTTLLFHLGTTRFVEGQDDEIRRLVASLTDLERVAAASGEQLAIEIVGHTDAEGAETANLPLSRMRAEAVRNLIGAEPLPHLAFTVDGVGSREPAFTGGSDVNNQRNRRVTLRVGRATGQRTGNDATGTDGRR